MLRNRSRAVTSKQALMTDHSFQLSSSTNNCTKPIPSFFGSPSFKAFTFKGMPEAEPVISPTSILEPYSQNPFLYATTQPESPNVFLENKHSWENWDTKGIGVALIASHDDENPNEKKNSSISKSSNKTVLFGTKLKVQIPSPANFAVSETGSPKSPADFGIKTRSCQFSGSGFANSGTQAKNSPQIFRGCLSMSELELSEDYTCVISYGPNPKTTHIYDDCVLQSSCNLSDNSNSVPKISLSLCHTCKKNLEHNNNIFIYRGARAFCSEECRHQEMLIDGEES